MESFKTLKDLVTIPIFDLFNLSKRENSFQLILPKARLTVSEHNFVFKASQIWNRLIDQILEKNEPQPNVIIISGSSNNSDFRASISFVKSKLKKYQNAMQGTRHSDIWESTTFFS